jgi:hypothetical protein
MNRTLMILSVYAGLTLATPRQFLRPKMRTVPSVPGFLSVGYVVNSHIQRSIL